jgi:hypothetical protein
VSSAGALRSLSGNNIYSGAITILNSGNQYVRIFADSDLLTITGDLINNYRAYMGGTGDVNVTGTVSGSGNTTNIFKLGTGTLTVNGVNW